ncbi:unnamed protein product [Zymoseptoria tritici ST99CH_1A5]|uniref:General stress protein FMN-binding split barrel domain-containing protein n=1 Tax=Zymoseptoria tritici ST99CH_1A5 TaxID=1276529 RepID=A0A1Y6L5G8_ZYMTR|nr:unnamed protein product [Zymoseptoria tritici ST99CH_3D1]SMY18588.1 unnamed protein product [Zymoseptoria tritici ST99CH_1A5]
MVGTASCTKQASITTPLSYYFSLNTMFSSLRITRITPFTSTFRALNVSKTSRSFTTTTPSNMPENLKQSEVDAQTDPSVAKQYDNESSAEEKFKDLYAIADGIKIGMLSTYRQGTGPVSRAMAVSKRSGPDFLFLANKHSNKISDLQSNKEVNLTFHDKSNQDWVSVTGEAVKTSGDDPRIKEIYSKVVSAWFGDLGDGVHNGGPEDPRMYLVEVRSKYISYYKHTSGMLGQAKEIGGAVLTGKVAQTGVLRELKEVDIEQARKSDSALTS